MMALCCTGPNHFIRLLPGSVALKAINTTIVFPRTQEIQRTNVIPKAVWRSIQDQSEGRPMKVREHRKHRFKEKSSRKLSSELLALTIGVDMLTENIKITQQVHKEPSRATVVSVMPMVSLKDRKSTSLGKQAVLSTLDQNCGMHCTHSMESEEKEKTALVSMAYACNVPGRSLY